MPGPGVIIFLIVVFSFAIVVSLTVWMLRQDRTNRANDSTATAAIRFIGGVFVFIGSFAVVTLWGAQGILDQRVDKEFASLTLLTDDIVLASPAYRDRSYELLEKYSSGVRQEEFGVQLEGGAPPVGGSAMVNDALDGYRIIIDEMEAGNVPGVESLRSEVTQLQLQYLDRLAWSPPFSSEILVPATIIALATLVIIGIFPAGSATWQKWAQALISTAVVVSVLSMIVVLLSPQFHAQRQINGIDEYLSQVRAELRN